MSTTHDEADDVERSPESRFRVVFRLIAVLAAVASLFALWSGEQAQIDDDLQLFAETSARPGETIALQALVLRDVEALAGPTLGKANVHVRLLDRQGSVLTKTQLRATPMDTLEGALRVPERAQGTLRLEAAVEGEPPPQLKVVRSLEVRSDVAVPAASARLAGPLQHFALGRVQALGSELAPNPFLPRVVAGSCVPEEPCRLLVWVGEPAAAVSLVASAAVTPIGQPEPASETSGLVTLSLRVHGAEADVTLRASRGGRSVADRSIRLPISLGETGIASRTSIARSLESVQLALLPPPGREHVIVDTFVAGRWARTKTVAFAKPELPVTLDAVPGALGLVRIQARGDRYSGESAGARVLYVQPSGESTDASLAAIARAARKAGVSEGATDAFENTRPAAMLADAERWAAFMLAPFEQLRMPLPVAASGRPVQLARLERVRRFERFGIAGVLVCCAFLVGASLLQKGMRASDEAGAILDEGSDGGRDAGAARLRDRLQVLVWVALVGLAFLAAALLVVAKPLWF